MVRTTHGTTRRCRTQAARRTKQAAAKHAASPTTTAPAAKTPTGVPSTGNPIAPIGPCADADLVPSQATVEAVRAAIVCLVNQERAKAGLGALNASSQMQSAADGFSLRMVLERFFAHVAPDGSDLLSRVLGSGYAATGGSYQLAENIGWGTGSLATPAAMVQGWMNSADHRANILTAAFRDTGVGIALGAPTATGGSSAATFTQDFGVR
jgi:uncharacterized protein YkwD